MIFQLFPDESPTIAELEQCKAKLISIIEEAHSLSKFDSLELRTIKSGLNVVQELIDALASSNPSQSKRRRTRVEDQNQKNQS